MKTLINWISISSIALIVLGSIHLIAILTFEDNSLFQNLTQEQTCVFAFMYLAAGIGTILPGLISKLLSSGLAEKNKKSWMIILICSIDALLIGIAAIIFMMKNPFAYLEFIVGLSLLMPTILIKKHI